MGNTLGKTKKDDVFLPTKIGIEWDLNDLTTEGWILATHSLPSWFVTPITRVYAG